MNERLPDWCARFSGVIARHSALADYPGRCVEFARDAAQALYGIAPVSGWRERFNPWDDALDGDKAGEMIAAGVAAACQQMGWGAISTQNARDGHWAVFGPPYALTHGLAVVTAGGARALRTVSVGLHAMSISRALQIWGR